MADTSHRALPAVALLAVAALIGGCGDDSYSGPEHQTIQTNIPGTDGMALAEAITVCNDTPGTGSVDVMGASGALLARRGTATGGTCVANDRYTSGGG